MWEGLLQSLNFGGKTMYDAYPLPRLVGEISLGLLLIQLLSQVHVPLHAVAVQLHHSALSTMGYPSAHSDIR
jgi:hypothetical protein